MRYLARISTPTGETQTSKPTIKEAIEWIGSNTEAVVYDRQSRARDGGLCWTDGAITNLGKTLLSRENDLTEAARAMGRVKSDKKAAAVRENGKKGGRPTVKYTWAVHYQCGIAYLRGDFDLRADYESPKTHRARFGGRWIRVVVDHDETGTATTGTGETVVRSIPRGWKTGSREFAE